MSLLINGLIKFMLGLLAVGLLLFLPAGTLAYWQGWLFIALLFIPMALVGIILYCKTPDLLAKRLASRESEKIQQLVVILSAVVFCCGFVLAGLDFRFGWSEMPIGLAVLAAVLQLFAYGIYAEVMRENAYLSRTVEVQENQKVVDTGLYGIVRHPMYSAVILLFLSIPIVLGSWLCFCLFLLCPLILIIRIINEEKVLEEGLEGYSAYKKRVKYRLLPFIW